MTVSSADRRRMRRLAADLAPIEQDEPAGETELDRATRAADLDRSRAGRAPLGPDDVPEEGFYRRARALGLGRRSR